MPLALLFTGFCVTFCPSCTTCSRSHNVPINVDGFGEDTGYVKTAQKVFRSLPTPIEMSILIKNLGIEYQPSLLNDPLNTSKYVTHNQMALNFGVYVTDLVYAGLFEQTQTMLRYKLAIQKMVDGLGMSSAVDNTLLKKLETNINNKEEMLEILADTYSSCSAFLNEEDRHFLTIAALVGGWVEGMYIASSLTNEHLVNSENKIEQLVIDQKLTFDMLWQVMSELDGNADIAALMSEMSGLVRAFDRIQIKHTHHQVSFDEQEKTNVIKSDASVDTDVFAEVKEQIQTIRYNFVK
jgi:hypothetical protein